MFILIKLIKYLFYSKNIYCIISVTSFLILNSVFIFSQFHEKEEKITIIRSNIIEKNPKIFKGNIFLSGNVELEYDKNKIFADTVLINKSENTIQAYSNVRIIMKNDILLTCEQVNYDNNIKKIVAKTKVTLIDKHKMIQNEELFYDRKNNQIYFNKWGIITDLKTNNIIISESGFFILSQERYIFNNILKMTTQNYIINSQKMIIHNNLHRTDFYGPTHIKELKNFSNYIYTENGYYYSHRKEFFLKKNSQIYYNNKILKGDNIYFNEKNGYGKILGNFTLKDVDKKQILKGGQGEIFSFKDSVIITKKPYGIQIFEQDSLYFAADMLIAIQQKKIKNSTIIHAFNNVKIFKSNFQGICDSIKIDELKGIIEFHKNPIFWIENHQITADTIFTYTNSITKKLDSIHLNNNSFIISNISSILEKKFNQIKGKKITISFQENEIFQILVKGNAQSISYINEENTINNMNIIKINKSNCGILLINIENKEINSILCKINGISKLYPKHKLPEKEKYLDNFIWKENDRLRKWSDILL